MPAVNTATASSTYELYSLADKASTDRTPSLKVARFMLLQLAVLLAHLEDLVENREFAKIHIDTIFRLFPDIGTPVLAGQTGSIPDSVCHGGLGGLLARLHELIPPRAREVVLSRLGLWLGRHAGPECAAVDDVGVYETHTEH